MRLTQMTKTLFHSKNSDNDVRHLVQFGLYQLAFDQNENVMDIDGASFEQYQQYVPSVCGGTLSEQNELHTYVMMPKQEMNGVQMPQKEGAPRSLIRSKFEMGDNPFPVNFCQENLCLQIECCSQNLFDSYSLSLRYSNEVNKYGQRAQIIIRKHPGNIAQQK